MKIQSNSKLLMIGDSITDCGRARSSSEHSENPLGNGYVSLINAHLTAALPQAHIHIINKGIGGDTVPDLAARWSSDVLELNPDWLSIMIGINDIWRQFDANFQPQKPIIANDVDKYAQNLNGLLFDAVRPSLKGLVLMTPFFVEPNRSDLMRAKVDQYREVVQYMADRYRAIFVDTQAAFDSILTELHPSALSTDRVHPNLTGHTILARAFLKAIDYTW